MLYLWQSISRGAVRCVIMRQELMVRMCAGVKKQKNKNLMTRHELDIDTTQEAFTPSSSSMHPSPSPQGSIQQLVLKSDPTAPDDQCEEDDPYVSLHRDTHTHTQSTETVLKSLLKAPVRTRSFTCCKHGTILPSSGRESTLHLTSRSKRFCPCWSY